MESIGSSLSLKPYAPLGPLNHMLHFGPHCRGVEPQNQETKLRKPSSSFTHRTSHIELMWMNTFDVHCDNCIAYKHDMAPSGHGPLLLA